MFNIVVPDVFITSRCNFACKYCVSKDTEIVMSDFTKKQIKDVKVGDSILGFEENNDKNKYRTYFPAIVTQTFNRKSKVIKLTLENGEEIIITSNHPILSGRNYWRKAGDINPEATTNNKIKCLDLNIPTKVEINEKEWNIGYLIGAMLGDGSIKKYPDKRWDDQWFIRIRLAVNDNEILEKCDEILQSYNIDFYRKEFDMGYRKSCNAIFSSKLETYRKLSNFINEHFRNNKNIDYCKGFLAGIYDTEGCFSCEQISISNKDIDIINEIKRCLDNLCISYEEAFYENRNIWAIRILRHQDQLDFIKNINSQVERKGIVNLYGRSTFTNLSISKVEELDEIDVYNLETTSHTYIANKICVHNCFEPSKCNKDLDIERFKKYCSDQHFLGFFTFGGEPLMRPDILKEIIDNTVEGKKENIKHIITNGSLIEKNLDLIKKYNIKVQISIDGPKDINDLNRVYHDGSGTYDTIMKNIEVCEKEGIEWSVHGVANRQSLPYLAEMYEWFFDMKLRSYKTRKTNNPIQNTINGMSNNLFQIIFEENYTDNDIDIVLEQLEKICEIFLNKKGLTEKQAKETIMQIFDHKGSSCGAGNGLLAVDTDLDIYPCHRLAAVPEKEKYKLGNLCDVETFENFEFYNSYLKMKKNRVCYSSAYLNRGFNDPENQRLYNWCPSTNYQTSKSIYYANPKYIILHKEINRKIKELIKKYGLTG